MDYGSGKKADASATHAAICAHAQPVLCRAAGKRSRKRLRTTPRFPCSRRTICSCTARSCSAARPSRVRRIVSLETSGTSGTRKRIFFTERDLEATVDFFHHGMDAVCAGTNRVGILMPGTNPDGALRPAFARHPALRRRAAVLRPHSRRGRLRALVSGKPDRNAGRDPISGASSGAAAPGAAGSKRAALLGLRLPCTR